MAIDIVLTLKYLALDPSNYGFSTEFSYTPPIGGYVNNDETEWNATTWSDMRIAKLAWFMISDNAPLAVIWDHQNKRNALLDALLLAGAGTNDMLYATSGSAFSKVGTTSYGRAVMALSNGASALTYFGVDTAISAAVNALVNSAPGTMDTLGEIAALLASDESGAAALATSVAGKVDKVTGKALSANDFTDTLKAKLDGITSGATANSTDASLLASAASAAAALGGKGVQGITVRSGVFPVFKSATVASGVAVFHLTADGLSTGTALFASGPFAESINVIVNDATASYQYGWVLSNSNKTLTVTCNKFTTANILSGILGQAAANAAVVTLQVWGN